MPHIANFLAKLQHIAILAAQSCLAFKIATGETTWVEWGNIANIEIWRLKRNAREADYNELYIPVSDSFQFGIHCYLSSAFLFSRVDTPKFASRKFNVPAPPQWQHCLPAFRRRLPSTRANWPSSSWRTSSCFSQLWLILGRMESTRRFLKIRYLSTCLWCQNLKPDWNR